MSRRRTSIRTRALPGPSRPPPPSPCRVALRSSRFSCSVPRILGCAGDEDKHAASPAAGKVLPGDVPGIDLPSAAAELPAAAAAPPPLPAAKKRTGYRRRRAARGAHPAARLARAGRRGRCGAPGLLRRGRIRGQKALPCASSPRRTKEKALLEACRKAQANARWRGRRPLTRDGATRWRRAIARASRRWCSTSRRDLVDLPGSLLDSAFARAGGAAGGAPRGERRLAPGDRHHRRLAARQARAEAFEREFQAAAGEVRGRLATTATRRGRAGKGPHRHAARRNGLPRPRPEVGDARAPLHLGDAAGVRHLDEHRPARRGHGQPRPGGRAFRRHALVRPARPPCRDGLSAPRSRLSIDQERLYALGIDAYRIGDTLLKPEVKRPALDGVTGCLTLGREHHSRATPTPRNGRGPAGAAQARQAVNEAGRGDRGSAWPPSTSNATGSEIVARNYRCRCGEVDLDRRRWRHARVRRGAARTRNARSAAPRRASTAAKRGASSSPRSSTSRGAGAAAVPFRCGPAERLTSADSSGYAARSRRRSGNRREGLRCPIARPCKMRAHHEPHRLHHPTLRGQRGAKRRASRRLSPSPSRAPPSA